MSLIYLPGEDSYLLQDTLKKIIPKILVKNHNIKILEIGIGSGIQLNTLIKLGVNKKNIFGTDINYEAIKKCKKLGFDCFFSDLFSHVKHKFDVIIFNPPYLPANYQEDKESRLITTGGKFGGEIINKFLEEALEYLNKDGKILLLTSSLTQKINWRSCEKKLIQEKKLFFEKLRVWEISSKVN